MIRFLGSRCGWTWDQSVLRVKRYETITGRERERERVDASPSTRCSADSECDIVTVAATVSRWGSGSRGSKNNNNNHPTLLTPTHPNSSSLTAGSRNPISSSPSRVSNPRHGPLSRSVIPSSRLLVTAWQLVFIPSPPLRFSCLMSMLTRCCCCYHCWCYHCWCCCSWRFEEWGASQNSSLLPIGFFFRLPFYVRERGPTF